MTSFIQINLINIWAKLKELDHKHNADNFAENLSLSSDIHMLGHLSHCYVFYVNIVYYIWVASKNTFKLSLHTLFYFKY